MLFSSNHQLAWTVKAQPRMFRHNIDGPRSMNSPHPIDLALTFSLTLADAWKLGSIIS